MSLVPNVGVQQDVVNYVLLVKVLKSLGFKGCLGHL
jgi:hypothetical protein